MSSGRREGEGEGEGELLEARGGRDKLGRQVRAGETRAEQARVRELKQNGRAVRGCRVCAGTHPLEGVCLFRNDSACVSTAWKSSGRAGG